MAVISTLLLRNLVLITVRLAPDCSVISRLLSSSFAQALFVQMIIIAYRL